MDYRAPLGASLSTMDIKAGIWIILLIIIDILIWLPFFKVYEKQVLENTNIERSENEEFKNLMGCSNFCLSSRRSVFWKRMVKVNVWDEFYKINNFEYNGDKAVDHYNLMEKDVELFNKIGLQTYRFSVS